jgi:hypothetical protein
MTVLVYRQRPQPEIRPAADDVLHELTDAPLVFLARGEVDLENVDPDEPEPARYGWAMIAPPRRDEDVLYLGDLASKSDYLAGDAIEENPEAHGVYDVAARVFKKRLERPVWAHAVGDDGAVEAHHLWYSQGAAELARRGVALRQEGVENVVFSIDEPR